MPRLRPVTGIDHIPQAARSLLKRVRARTCVCGVVTVVESAAFLWICFLVSNPVQKLGSLLTVVALVYMTGQLLSRRAGELADRCMADATDLALSYRAELERQRDFHRGWWFWSRLAGMIPGLTLFCIGGVIADPKYLPGYAVIAACFVSICVAAVAGNLREARRYQHQIDGLDAVLRQSQ
jgi:hypothetical protein